MKKGIIFLQRSSEKDAYRQQLNELTAIAVEHQIQVIAQLVVPPARKRSFGSDAKASKKLLNMIYEKKPEKLFVQEISQLGVSMIDVSNVVEELTCLKVNIYVNNLKIDTLINGRKNPDAFVLFALLSEIKQFEWNDIRNQLFRQLQRNKKCVN